MLQSQSPSWRDQPVNVPLTESVPWTRSVEQFPTGAPRKVPLLCWWPYTNIVKGTTDHAFFFELNQILESDVDDLDSYYKLTTTLTAFAINKLYWVDIFTRQSLVSQVLTKWVRSAWLSEWVPGKARQWSELITIVLVVMRMNCTSCSATRLRSEKCQAVENKSFGIAERLSKLRTIFCSSQVAWSFSKIFVCICPNWGAFFNSCGSQAGLVFKQYLCLYFS